VPFAIELLAAEMVMDCSAAAVTVRVNEFDVTPFWAAVTLVEPAATPIARPLPSMLAAEGFEELQMTEFVRFWVLPSLKVPVAVNWSLVPFAIEPLTPVMVSDRRATVAMLKFTALCEAP